MPMEAPSSFTRTATMSARTRARRVPATAVRAWRAVCFASSRPDRTLGMTTRTVRSLAISGVLSTLATLVSTADAQQSRPAFRFEEATIAQVHAALRQRSTTCHAIVAGYLARIERFDKRGPALNAIVLTNPNALAIADSLDRRFAASRTFVGSLHCI